MLQQAARWLRDQCRDALAVLAVYQPRNGEERVVKAVLGTTLFEATDAYGIVTRTETRDFLVSAEEMPDEPQKGDAFIWNATRYEVLAAQGEPCWRWSDAFHLIRRIHTKEIGQEEENTDG